MKYIHKITLGGAQFGLRYGIASSKQQIDFHEAEKIIKAADSKGIKRIDTSSSYGSSEEVLGIIGIPDWQVTTKVNIDKESSDSIYDQVVKTLERSKRLMRLDRIYCVLIHYPQSLTEDELVHCCRALHDARNSGFISRLGFSIYKPTEIERLLNFHPDILQAPINVFDQSIIETGWLDKLTNRGIEVHARSVFLQGLLLMDKDKIPVYFHRFVGRFENLEKMIKESNLSRLEFLLWHIFANPKLKSILIGVHTVNHLSEILDALLKLELEIDTTNFHTKYAEPLATSESELIYPYNWK